MGNQDQADKVHIYNHCPGDESCWSRPGVSIRTENANAANMVTIEKDIDPKKYFPDSKHMIIYAFTLAGIHYFKFHDPFNIPAERALTSITFYREVDLNCDKAYLKAHAQAVINCLSATEENPVIEVGKALQLERQLLMRIDMPKDSDLMYKLASVVFFDQNENPLIYEFEYGKQKIARWKKETTLRDFFLQKPIMELIPYLSNAGENLETYDSLAQRVKAQHLDSIRDSLSSKQLTTLNDLNDL